MTMIEVRCCCQPTKLLGWLPFGDPAYMPLTMSFRWWELENGTPATPDLEHPWAPAPPVVEKRLELTVGYFGCGIASRPALKSEETPIETLRKIPGFIENPTPAEVFVDPPFEVVG